ncbi:MAG: histidine phosphatase family protein [Lachnospiraceae bacterium]|nr:histidine phosphatase family protein [Lachnospiraceae bacterium]
MLYVIRHGITDWNLKKKLQGQTDIPLNEEGRRMAKEAAAALRDIHFDLCYSSPLIRAKETAEILLRGRDIPILTDDRLKEMAFGICEGAEDYRHLEGTSIPVLFRTPEKYTDPPEGAESLDDLFARTGEFLTECIYPELNAGKDILIVGHGAMNSAIISNIRHLPRNEFWSTGIPNCKLIRLL